MRARHACEVYESIQNLHLKHFFALLNRNQSRCALHPMMQIETKRHCNQLDSSNKGAEEFDLTHRETRILEPSGAEGEQGVMHDITEALLQKYERLSECGSEVSMGSNDTLSSVLVFGFVERLSLNLHVTLRKCECCAATTDNMLFQWPLTDTKVHTSVILSASRILYNRSLVVMRVTNGARFTGNLSTRDHLSEGKE